MPSASLASQVEILSASDPAEAARWDALVSRSSFPDSYYRPGYVRAYEVEGHGRALAVHVRCGGAEFLVPMLLRPIGELEFARGSALQDAITPYGYGGMLSLGAAPSNEANGELLRVLKDWGKCSGIVSCMVRLHPLLEQHGCMARFASEDVLLHRFGPTMAVRVSDWSESALRKGRRSGLKIAREALKVTWSAPRPMGTGDPPIGEALRLFRGIYEETMDRLHASPFYHFSAKYYEALAEGLGEALAIALAWNDGHAVGGSIFMADQDCAHYHLSGTNDAGRALDATTLLIREGIEWARRRGCKWLHLGGGVRGDDSLFDFKKGFGGDVYQYSFAGLVTDRAAYDQLVSARRATGQPPRPDFFPAYRA